MTYRDHFTPGVTPQTEPARADQVENRAGGFVFAVDRWTMLDRWLLLGSEGNTYYASEREMTRANAKSVLECLAEDGARVVARTVEISDAGRAPKNDAALFVLALAASDDKRETRSLALQALPKVARIGTHLFQFVANVDSMRGWGRGLRQAVARWYADKPADDLAYQILKYQNREKWSHKDTLRLSHGELAGDRKITPGQRAVFEWIRAGGAGFEAYDVRRKKSGRLAHYDATDRAALPELLDKYDAMRTAACAHDVVGLIKSHGFTREMVPTRFLNDVGVWEALLEHMPMTAMIRNLGKMTSVGLLAPLSSASKTVSERLGDKGKLKKARVHPIALLSALKVYEQGHGEKGKLSWTPDRKIIDALNDGFYLAFDTIEPTGKNWLLGIDVSGSMGSGVIAGIPGITPRVAAAVMAMVTARTEENWLAFGFSHQFVGLNISPRQRLDDVVRVVNRQDFGGTDAAIPIRWALEHKCPVDMFEILTDNETWAGQGHAFEMLKRFRREINPRAKLAAVAFVANEYSMCDPTDAGQMNFAGFDAAAPSLLAQFAIA